VIYAKPAFDIAPTAEGRNDKQQVESGCGFGPHVAERNPVTATSALNRRQGKPIAP
jgi:hypothetical protein